ncbi:hypothetical protein ACO2Q3_24115 [Caulobacter sp. KR2-114]|uniref:hypothetical protein n=1 Tax=Caulobacter sp. KR2-114 TaxID=3400912 RepID=UPI003BFDF0F6
MPLPAQPPETVHFEVAADVSRRLRRAAAEARRRRGAQGRLSAGLARATRLLLGPGAVTLVISGICLTIVLYLEFGTHFAG